MPKCSFCGIAIPKATGKMFVFVSGRINNYCSNKCEKNTGKLKRKPLNMRWTEAYRKEHKKESGVGDRKVKAVAAEEVVEKKPGVAVKEAPKKEEKTSEDKKVEAAVDKKEKVE